MMQKGFERMTVTVLGDDRELVVSPQRTLSHAVLDELEFVRREAQIEADQAYELWDHALSREAYTVYRAAQDRADAAQDALADWATLVVTG